MLMRIQPRQSTLNEQCCIQNTIDPHLVSRFSGAMHGAVQDTVHLIGAAAMQWCVYVGDIRFPGDRNAVEKAIRPSVVGRKNWLFSGNETGASASPAKSSVLQTARAKGLDSYWHFRYLLKKLQHAPSHSDLEGRLPQQIDPTIITEYQKGPS